MMGYDLLISGRQMQIVTLPFYWLARLLARPMWWGPDATYFSITRGDGVTGSMRSTKAGLGPNSMVQTMKVRD